MRQKLTIDAAGRIVVPKPLRRLFHLVPGSVLDLEIGDNAIILRPRVHESTLVEEKGLLVHEGEPSGDLLGAVEATRAHR